MAQKNLVLLLLLLLGSAILAGCNLAAPSNGTTSPAAPSDTPPPVVQSTDTPAPTPTEVVDYAAMVNGEGIRLSSYEASLSQFQQALIAYPELLAPEQTAEERVLEELVSRALLSQAARQAGFSADSQMVETRLQTLIDQAGGQDAFEAWLAQNGYTLETFRHELPWEIEAAWQRDQIASAVPESLPQVRACQILFYDPFQAARAYDQLQAGIPFDTVANNNDPDQLGYLDWFPRGYLLNPELEEIVFSLQPGQYSQVIETLTGYHILQVLEIDPDRPLSADARLSLQEQALRDWLADQRAQSQVENLLP